MATPRVIAPEYDIDCAHPPGSLVEVTGTPVWVCWACGRHLNDDHPQQLAAVIGRKRTRQ